MAKAILSGLATFLIVLGCYTLYQRETAILAGLQSHVQAIQVINQRLSAVEGFLNQQIQAAQNKIPLVKPDATV